MAELDRILAELEPSLGPLSGQPVALDGGITNHNFRATLGGEEYVVRRHGAGTRLLGIDRSAEEAATRTAAALGIAPELVAHVPGAMVTRFVACGPLDPAGVRGHVEEVASALRRFHDSALVLPVTFSVPGLLAAYARTVAERGGTPPAAHADTVAAADRIAATLELDAPRPCHNDLLAGNIIRARADGRLMIVDWEYAAMGDPYFDLGNLSVNNEFDAGDDERLLGAYQGAPATAARRARLALMRVLSDAREAAWGVVQGSVSELDFDFGAYAERHFERLLAAVARPEFEEWLAAA